MTIDAGAGGTSDREWPYLRQLLDIEFRALQGLHFRDDGSFRVDEPVPVQVEANQRQRLPNFQEFETRWNRVTFTPVPGAQHTFSFTQEFLIRTLPLRGAANDNRTRIHRIREEGSRAVITIEGDAPELDIDFIAQPFRQGVFIFCRNYAGVWSFQAAMGAMNDPRDRLEWEVIDEQIF